jgi:hypothetical protein
MGFESSPDLEDIKTTLKNQIHETSALSENCLPQISPRLRWSNNGHSHPFLFSYPDAYRFLSNETTLGEVSGTPEKPTFENKVHELFPPLIGILWISIGSPFSVPVAEISSLYQQIKSSGETWDIWHAKQTGGEWKRVLSLSQRIPGASWVNVSEKPFTQQTLLRPAQHQKG